MRGTGRRSHLAPAADVPGRRRRRHRAGARQGPGGVEAPLRPQFEQALEEVATDAGLARSGETTWAFGDPRRVRDPDPGRAPGHGVPGTGRRGGDRRAGRLRLHRRGRRLGTGSACVGCCCSRSRSPSDAATARRAVAPPRSSAWPGRRTPPSPELLDGLPRGRGAGPWSTRAPPVRDAGGVRRAARRGRAADARGARRGPCWPSVLRVLDALAAAPTRCSAAAPRWRCCRRSRT